MLLVAIACIVSATPGKLFLAGGGSTPVEIPKRFVAECGGPDASIIVLPQATVDTTKSKGSEEFLRENGAKNVWTFQSNEVTPEQRKDLEERLKKAKGVWVGGGVQGRFIERFGKKWLDDTIKPLVKAGMNYYGTSAGAMACSDPMIEGPGEAEGTSRTGPGMGLTKWVVDTHFTQRKREPRLRYALEKTSQKFGIGINERGWVVIQADKILEKHGDPLVIEPKS
ncbi:MAG: Type 1 glutamine amidotransferase-like domain-containing protein [Chlorobia bacterium]|nr:Type 1 glutamine amidotransferase-like domain-containing protein [Fimbriimonadaceae bacterium]